MQRLQRSLWCVSYPRISFDTDRITSLQRKMRARKRARDEFNASQFRKSALILDEPKEPRRPRPPSMLERKRNVNAPLLPPSNAYPYSDTASQYTSEHSFGREGGSVYNGSAPSMYNAPGGRSQYGGPQGSMYGASNPQGAAPMPYGGQNMYNQFPDRNGYGGAAGYGAAGFGGPAPYAPYSQNTHQPQQFHPGYPGHNGQQQHQQQQYHNFGPGQHLNPNSYSVPGSPARSNSTGSNNAPNPFSEAPPSRNIGTPSPSSGSASPPAPAQAPNQFLTRHDSHSSMHGDDDAAPPAYTDEDGTYANLQRDVKQPVVMNPEGTSSSREAPAPAPPAKPTAPAPAPAASTQAESSRRPASAYTVYDPADAYGGM